MWRTFIQLLEYLSASAPSQDLYRRALESKHLGPIVTDGCPGGLAAAIPTVYPRVRHQRCWVHKMRNILEKIRKARRRRSEDGCPGNLLG
jgi:transposase-like protein